MSDGGAAELAPLHPALLALAEEEEALGGALSDLARQRAAYEAVTARHGGPPAEVAVVADEPLSVDGDRSLRVRRYVPAGATGTVVYFHGGGWMLGGIVAMDVACRAVANAACAEVVSVDYRLVPEHRFPAAVQDADAAVRWAQQGRDGAVAVAGDSAGANLATVAARRARDDGRPVVAQALAYPICAAPRDTASYERFGDSPLLDRATMERLFRLYADGADPRDPDLAPLHAQLAGMPPTFVGLAAHDVLRDDGAEYAEALRAAGVAVEVREWPDMAHGFLRLGGIVAAAGELAGAMGAFLRARLGAGA